MKELKIDYIENSQLVRGLDYYNGFCFEFIIRKHRDRSQNAICGGGRYELVNKIARK